MLRIALDSSEQWNILVEILCYFREYTAVAVVLPHSKSQSIETAAT